MNKVFSRKMRNFLLFFCVFASSVANSKPKKPVEPPKPIEIKAIITVTDKMYSKKSTYETPLNQSFIVSDELSITITKCLRNNQKQEFVFVKSMRNGEEFFKKWIPIQENAIHPIEDKRYDITFDSCNYYEKLPIKDL